MRTSFTLRETDSEASLTPDALRQRLGKDGTIHTATMRSQVIFYMEFFAPPRQYERYLIPQSREEALLRSQEP
ncbi:MAG: hypothetical protein NZ556_03780 [Fimbriimonadales bacterium]|nr:hypothetical protein [Fimbriimonadales bacterium]